MTMGQQNRRKRVVVVGGGTGTYTVLTGLKQFAGTLDLTAVVAMTDSGGSTGRLRDEFGYLPVGDVRMALTALASDGGGEDTLLRKLFLHRFATDGAVHGHNFGNLLLVALTDILGSEESAIEAASRVLRVCGTVLPVTTERVELVAEYADGKRIVGEHAIDEPEKGRDEHRIITLSVTPEAVLNERVHEALVGADLIVFGPGDLYTSVLANCVVNGFREALTASPGKILYVTNLMTKVGQTSGMNIQEHVAELERYSGRTPDYVLVNQTPLPEELLSRYAKESEHPVAGDCDGIDASIQYADLLASEEIVRSPGDVLRRSLIRHDADKLAEAIFPLI
jgi:uncharacterized cofD-like protein